MQSKHCLSNTIVCTPSFSAGEGVHIFKKKGGGLTEPQFLEEGYWEKGRWPYSGGGCSFYIKNKLKPEIFNDKESLQTKMFFSVITKDLNCEMW